MSNRRFFWPGQWRLLWAPSRTHLLHVQQSHLRNYLKERFFLHCDKKLIKLFSWNDGKLIHQLIHLLSILMENFSIPSFPSRICVSLWVMFNILREKCSILSGKTFLFFVQGEFFDSRKNYWRIYRIFHKNHVHGTLRDKIHKTTTNSILLHFLIN